MVERPARTPVFSTSVTAERALGGWLAVSAGAPTALIALSFFLPPVAGVAVGGVSALIGAIMSVPLLSAWRRTRRQARDAAATLRNMAHVVWTALSESGRVRSPLAVAVWEGERRDADATRAEITMAHASLADQKTFGIALEELCGPIRSPRFVLEVDRGGGSWWVRAVLERADAPGPGSSSPCLPRSVVVGRTPSASTARGRCTWVRPSCTSSTDPRISRCSQKRAAPEVSPERRAR